MRGRGLGKEEEAPSAIEQLPQHVVHWLAVLLRGRVGRRRSRGRGGFGLSRRAGRIGARDAAALARTRGALGGRALTRALTRSLAQPAQTLLQQIADGLAKLAAERIAGLPARRGARCTGGTRARLATKQTADRRANAGAVEPGAARAEQALAHLLELGIGRFRIIQHALHLRINPRRPPR